MTAGLADHQSRMELLFNSSHYRQLVSTISSSNARFADLSPQLQLTATYMLTHGLEGELNTLWEAFYTRPIPTIEQFLQEQVLTTAAPQLFESDNIWRRNLLEIFAPGSICYEMVLTGAIGTAKTSSALVSHLYNLVRVTSLIDPQLTIGAAPHTLLIGQMFSVTLDKGELSILRPFIGLMRGCPAYFQPVRKKDEFADFAGSGITPYVDNSSWKSGGSVELPNDIMIKTGSTLQHSVAFSLFAALLDEAELYGSLGQAMAIYRNLKERVNSRFLGSRFVLLSLISSAASTSGVISTYVKTIPASSQRTRVMSYAIWDVKHFDAYDKGYFYVMRGTKTHPSRILDQTEHEQVEAGGFVLPANCEAIKVPLIYREEFVADLEGSLRNKAGRQTLGDNVPFDDTSKIEDALLVPEFLLEAPLGSPVPLHTKLPADLFEDTLSGRRLRRYPSAPRYLHADLAEVAEAGLSMWHKELADDGYSVYYVADFLCWITGGDKRIDINAIKQLQLDLVRIYAIHFGTVSADQYQSAAMRQQLEVEQVADNVEYVSVDRNAMPYLSLASINAGGFLKAGRCPKFRRQLENVAIDDKGRILMVDKAVRKDIADSGCGGVHNAMLAIADQPGYLYSMYKGKRLGPDKTLAGYESVI